jgi:hypothetical protein
VAGLLLLLLLLVRELDVPAPVVLLDNSGDFLAVNSEMFLQVPGLAKAAPAEVANVGPLA